MKILSAAEMREVDRLTTDRHGIPGLTLMENAGKSVADFIARRLPNFTRKRILVFCGKGNNGGDGFVVARKLREFGARPVVYLFAAPEEMRGDAAVNRDRWKHLGGELHVATSAEEIRAARSAAQAADVMIDA